MKGLTWSTGKGQKSCKCLFQ